MTHDPAGRSWRPQAHGEEGRGVGPRWRSEQEPVLLTRRRVPWRWGRILLLFVLFTALCSVFIWMSLWLRPASTTSLVVMGAAYQENLLVPHNVYGWNGIQQLAKYARGNNSDWEEGGLNLYLEPREVKNPIEWDKDIADFPGKTLLLFISLQGGSDRKGAYLLCQDVSVKDGGKSLEQSKIRLPDLIAKLAKFPRDRSVVLVLEATQMTDNWSLGMLQNNFARELEKLNDTIEAIPNLIVISASGPDQQAWPSETLGQTAFSYYFTEGLRGAADSYPKDGRVQGLELYSYVKRMVQDWAVVNRDAHQSPVLLPLGRAGRERAREIYLNHSPRYAPPDSSSWKAFSPSANDELNAAWNEFSSLEQSSPAPAVFTPQLWRLYQTMLLRYESLFIANAPDAPSVRQRLRELAQSIELARYEILSSAENTLPMFTATGHPPLPAQQVTTVLQQLWDAEPKKLAQLWRDVQAKTAPDELRRLRMQLCEWVIERAAEDPTSNFDRAVTLINLLDDPLQIRPAENHFLLMLRRDLPGMSPLPAFNARLGNGVEMPAKNNNVLLTSLLRPIGAAAPSQELLRQALKTRVRAERAVLGLPDAPWSTRVQGYPYTEDIFPWIRDWTQPGDSARQRGQDLLFVGATASQEQASKLLDEAYEQYATAQERALQVRRGLEVRDAVWPKIPFLVEWIGHRRIDAEGGITNKSLSADKLETLCFEVHELADILIHPKGADCAHVAQTANKVWNDFTSFEAAARIFRLGLDEVDLASVWRELDTVLRVPMSDVKLRMQMIGKRARIGLRRQLSMDDSKRTEESTAQVSRQRLALAEGAEQAAKLKAQRQGKLAMPLLGEHWFNECCAEMETYEQVNHRLQTFVVEEKWWESLTIIGEEIGARWRRLPGAIVNELNAARKDPTKLQLNFERADHYNRMLDAVGASSVEENASSLLRTLTLVDLLVSQAKRSFKDHWYALDPSQPPYFRDAASSFLNDASNLAKRQSLNVPAIEKIQGELKDAGDLDIRLVAAPGVNTTTKFDATSSVDITTENTFSLDYVLHSPKVDTDIGFPVVWANAGSNIVMTGKNASLRRAENFAKGPNVSLSWELACPLLAEAEINPPTSPLPLPSNFTVNGYYRGQRFSNVTRLTVYPVADRVVSQSPLPVRASVAVRASKELHRLYGQGGGSLVIILDCSGSMGPARGQPFTKTTKFNEATAALRGMLKKIPPGTKVSIWAFGQAMGADRTVQDAERTIQQLIAPTTWNPSSASLIDNVMQRVDYPALLPWNESPIVHSMYEAARRDLSKASGFKTMVVITDGMDNRFASDKAINPTGEDVPTFIRQHFQQIEINVVGFKIVDKEEAAARKQFQVIEQMPLPGKFYSVGKATELSTALENVLRQKLRYWIDREDGRPVPGFGEVGLDISTGSAGDQWLPGGLLPGPYKVRVKTNHVLTQSIALNQADLLLVNVAANKDKDAVPGSLIFSRVLYSLSDFPWKPAMEMDNWRLAVLQNQKLPNQGLKMLATLERKNDPLAAALQQVTPSKVWFEVALPGESANGNNAGSGSLIGDDGAGGGNSTRPVYQSWHYQPGFPAPAWSFRVAAWPNLPGTATPRTPILKAWWTPDEQPTPQASIEKGHDFQKPQDIRDLSVPLPEGSVVIESIGVEDHLVVTRPASGDKQARREKKTCLVVRLRHRPNYPVWAGVPGLSTIGAEHRFYTTAGKYTGVFWPVTRDQISLLMNRLDLYSLRAFKAKAEARQYAITLDNIYQPQSNDAAPLPATNLPYESDSVDSVSSPQLLPVPLSGSNSLDSTGLMLPPWFFDEIIPKASNGKSTAVPSGPPRINPSLLPMPSVTPSLTPGRTPPGQSSTEAPPLGVPPLGVPPPIPNLPPNSGIPTITIPRLSTPNAPSLGVPENPEKN